MSVVVQREAIIQYLKTLRQEIIDAFERFEKEHLFVKTPWQHHSGGGGEMAVIRGDVFEKGAVNFSAVEGKKLPLQETERPFFATGVSLITHMHNPHMPTAHFNVRYIETEDIFWFGGGYDLTPMGFPYDEDTKHFHSIAEKATGQHYDVFKQQAAEYFYIKHRKKERGVGGIFFDHYNTGDFDTSFALMQSVGNSFLPAILPIYKKRNNTPFTEKDKALQNTLRGHYVEFNLAYDRGTKFGFESGGNPDAILCSLPPTATW